MDKNTPIEDMPTTTAKPAFVALNVLALCFSLALVGRGLGESFTVFLKPIAVNIIDFGADPDRATWEAVAQLSGGTYQNLATSASPDLATAINTFLS